ncbi:lipid-binding SYLF domain-containing protein [bacterium]|nr:lipid-binding SYLF domain-containing protein [bacterium]MBU1428545.1 lipid-binding SYLF domain-containing protein [bacterium]
MKYIILTPLLFLVLTCIVQAAPTTMTPSEIINESIEVLEEMSASEDSGAFGALLKEAKGIAIFPSIIKIGWGIGGQYGKGIIFRKDSRVGICYGPAFVKIKSISVGPQIGIQSIALVLVISNERGMEGFMEDNLTLGGTASIAAGPLGRSLSADTDYKFKASIYSYSISKGAYIGASFQGSAIEEDSEANELFYGKSISNRTILENRVSINPAVLKLLLLIKKVSK